jgi:hypothetical protein
MGSLSKLKENPKTEIAYGLWLSEASSGLGPSGTSLRDLTISWLRFGYQGPVIESPSLKTILNEALKSGHHNCFIQTPGNIISEDWKLPHWGQADFHECMQKLAQMNNFLVCANIFKTDSYYALDTSCFLVDLDRYKAMGCPDFGHETTEPIELMNPKTIIHLGKDARSSSLLLEPTNQHTTAIPEQHGWGFIHASLSNGLAIPQIPENIAEKRLSLTSISFETAANAKNASEKALLEMSSGAGREKFLNGVDTQISRGRTGVFLWNIESYDDLPAMAPVNISSIHTISDLYCVAAGFKPNMLMRRQGFLANTKVTFFDYSEQALKVRKTLVQEWDGLNYPAFCRKLMDRFPADKTFYQLWDGLQPDQIDWDDVDRLWELELNQWGGAEVFRDCWQAQRALKYKYIQCDVVNNPKILLDRIKPSPSSTIWWSNAFSTIAGNWLLSINERRRLFNLWIEGLAATAPECRIYGADQNNTAINNISAVEYSAKLETLKHTAQQDELIPQLQAAKALRF